jgi:hypothetical protein
MPALRQNRLLSCDDGCNENPERPLLSACSSLSFKPLIMNRIQSS